MRSPCIKVCRVVDNQCLGCRRYLSEIAAWSSLSDIERDLIIDELPQRPIPDDPDRPTHHDVEPGASDG